MPIPRDPNVVTILKQYSTAEKAVKPKRPGSAEADIFEEVISGIKVYFDRCLGNILLYRFERQQYVDIRRKNESKEASDLYGAEHLLRLFGTRLLAVSVNFDSISSWFDCAYKHGPTKRHNA